MNGRTSITIRTIRLNSAHNVNRYHKDMAMGLFMQFIIVYTFSNISSGPSVYLSIERLATSDYSSATSSASSDLGLVVQLTTSLAAAIVDILAPSSE